MNFKLRPHGRERPRSHLFFQKFLDFQRSHASRASGRDRLTIAAVLYIAAGIDSVHTGEDVILRFQVAVLIHLKLPIKYLGVGDMANAQEHRTGGKIPDLTSLEIPQRQAGDLFLVNVVYVFDDRIEQRRWMTVTFVAKRDRKIASSMAESPPPITVISLPEKKKPSHVAQEETPCPISCCS
jgi:hypothetical protein